MNEITEKLESTLSFRRLSSSPDYDLHTPDHHTLLDRLYSETVRKKVSMHRKGKDNRNIKNDFGQYNITHYPWLHLSHKKPFQKREPLIQKQYFLIRDPNKV